MACAILERISGLKQSSKITTLRYGLIIILSWQYMAPFCCPRFAVMYIQRIICSHHVTHREKIPWHSINSHLQHNPSSFSFKCLNILWTGPISCNMHIHVAASQLPGRGPPSSGYGPCTLIKNPMMMMMTFRHIQFDPQYDNLSAYHKCFHSSQPIRDKYNPGMPIFSVPLALLSRNRLRQELRKNYSQLNF